MIPRVMTIQNGERERGSDNKIEEEKIEDKK